jgi:hypothetical protein
MKIFICSSKHLYQKIPRIREELEKRGHKITLPNSYEDPLKEEEMKKKGQEVHAKWKGRMIRLQTKKVQENDAILVLNFDKNEQLNYIGGATFLEIFKAFELRKKIFLFNSISRSIFEDELRAMKPIILNGDLSKIK